MANYLGCDKGTYSKIENGDCKLSKDEVLKLNSLFGVSVYTKEKLDDDKAAIESLIRFKKQMKEK